MLRKTRARYVARSSAVERPRRRRSASTSKSFAAPSALIRRDARLRWSGPSAPWKTRTLTGSCACAVAVPASTSASASTADASSARSAPARCPVAADGRSASRIPLPPPSIASPLSSPGLFARQASWSSAAPQDDRGAVGDRAGGAVCAAVSVAVTRPRDRASARRTSRPGRSVAVARPSSQAHGALGEHAAPEPEPPRGRAGDARAGASRASTAWQPIRTASRPRRSAARVARRARDRLERRERRAAPAPAPPATARSPASRRARRTSPCGSPPRCRRGRASGSRRGSVPTRSTSNAPAYGVHAPSPTRYSVDRAPEPSPSVRGERDARGAGVLGHGAAPLIRAVVTGGGLVDLDAQRPDGLDVAGDVRRAGTRSRARRRPRG